MILRSRSCGAHFTGSGERVKPQVAGRKMVPGRGLSCLDANSTGAQTATQAEADLQGDLLPVASPAPQSRSWK
jgi:hypothetical protein